MRGLLYQTRFKNWKYAKKALKLSDGGGFKFSGHLTQAENIFEVGSV